MASQGPFQGYPFFLFQKPWPLCPNRLAGEHPKVPDMWVICPQAGAKQRVSRKGCSWVLAIKWGPGGKRGIRGSEFLNPSSNFPQACKEEGALTQGQRHSTGVGLGCLGHWSSCTSGPPHLAGPHYSRATAGLMGEVAPELSLAPAASFSFLPLYWPMKEPSSLNWTSTLPP